MSMTSGKIIAGKIVVAVAVTAMIGLFAAGTHHYSSTMDRILLSPHVTEIKSEDLRTGFRIGRGEDCGGRDCWTLPEFDDTAWDTIRMPREALDKRFTGKDDGDAAYYRFSVDVTKELLDYGEAVSFSPNWICHRTYSVYVNGHQVFSGTGMSPSGDIIYQKINIPLPVDLLKEGRAQITIKAPLTKGDLGIHHFGKLLLGPTVALSTLYIQAEHGMGSYYLLYLVSHGGVFVFFGLIFLLTKTRPGFGFILSYALVTTLVNLSIGNFLTIPFTIRVPVYFGFKALASVSLLFFFLAWCRQRKPAFWVAGAIGLVFSGVTIYVAVAFGNGNKDFSIAIQHRISNIFLFSTVIAALAAMFARIYRSGAGGIRNMGPMIGATFLYAVLIGSEFFWKPFKGYDTRPLFDLIFFYFVAYLCLAEFGVNQIRIGVLELRQSLVEKIFEKYVGKSNKDGVLSGDDITSFKDLVIMTCEVRNFSDLHQLADPREVIALLAELSVLVESVVSGSGGRIHRISGHQVRVAWGLENRAAEPGSAVLDLLNLRAAMQKWNEDRRNRGVFSVEIVASLTRGRCVVGVIETGNSMDYTVVGQPVDDGVEALATAKVHGVDLVLSSAVYAASAAFVVAEEIMNTDPGEYKLIGSFDENGDLVTWSPRWQMQFSHVTEPGLVTGSGANLNRVLFNMKRSA